MQEVLDRWTDRSAASCRPCWGRSVWNRPGDRIGRRYHVARTSLDALALLAPSPYPGWHGRRPALMKPRAGSGNADSVNRTHCRCPGRRACRSRRARGEHRHRAPLVPSPRPRSGNTSGGWISASTSAIVPFESSWMHSGSWRRAPIRIRGRWAGCPAPEGIGRQTKILLLTELHDVQWCRPRGH